MSRSIKKNPYVNTACCGRKGMTNWKKDCNRTIRRKPIEDDLKDYKKINDLWSAPNDGKHYFDNPTAYSK